MFAPYQSLEVAGNFIVAATGNELHTFNAESGDQVSTFTVPARVVESKNKKQAKESDKVVIDITPESEETPEAGSDDPPSKRRKLSENDKQEVKEEGNAAESEKKGRTKAKQLRPPADGSVAPNFIALASTKDGRHVIGVTGEDKSLRVFEHENGVLKQISERSMAKRPCALAITADESLIITADKFGDVFSLPLHIPESAEQQPTPVQAAPSPAVPKQFVSSANDLTVHSARNRKALENQLKQNVLKAEKAESNAGQTLLLGHVSMLTDIALIEREGRSYIVTADRDEHIRVSRGIPQAHIIENYCFGHTDFVTKLCFPESAPHLMISGGGDDDLYVWEWKTGKLLQRANLVSLVEKIIGSKADGEKTQIVVSGIKHLHAGGDLGSIAVTCEGVPAVFIFSLSSTSGLQFVATQPLSGNALAMAPISTGGLIVSIDTIHKAGSTIEGRGATPVPVMPLEAFELGDRSVSTSLLRFKPTEASGLDVDKWSTLLYSLGNLRKRAGEE